MTRPQPHNIPTLDDLVYPREDSDTQSGVRQDDPLDDDRIEPRFTSGHDPQSEVPLPDDDDFDLSLFDVDEPTFDIGELTSHAFEVEQNGPKDRADPDFQPSGLAHEPAPYLDDEPCSKEDTGTFPPPPGGTDKKSTIEIDPDLEARIRSAVRQAIAIELTHLTQRVTAEVIKELSKTHD